MHRGTAGLHLARSAALPLPGAAIGIATFVWFSVGTLVPIAPDGILAEYLFVAASPLVLPASFASALLLLWLAHRQLFPPGERGRAESAAYLRPLALLGLAPLGAVVLAPGAGTRLSVAAYVLIDLRCWWGAALVAAALVRLDRTRGWSWRRRLQARWGAYAYATRLLVLEGLLLVVILTWAVASSPYLRFTGVLHGDEPKYIRYAENFYQGRGLNVDGQRSFEDLSLAYSPPVLHNLVLAARAIRENARDAIDDLRTFATHGFSAEYNRARYAGAWFFESRRGGLYQVHNPGWAFVLFPAYFIDRHFLSTAAGYGGTFPAQLVATNLLCLMVWAVWGVVVFRLLRAAIERDGLAWVLALAAMLTMPVSAFPFQIYPEAAAGLIVTATCLWLIRQADPAGGRAALLAGAAVAYLPWLHVRFLVLSCALAAWAAGTAKQRWRFAAAWMVGIAALSLYSYHLTGSLSPDAMYQTEGGVPAWEWRLAIESARAYPFDRIWGFFPHAPVYLLALPGWVILARHRPRVAALVATAIAALLVPSMGHGFSAAGATPLRHLVAVVPLAMVPLGWTLIALGKWRPVRIAFAVLLVLSLHVSWSYNLHHFKEVGRFVYSGVSGWAPNLLFPWTHHTPWEQWTGTFALYILWVAGCAGLILIPARLRPHASAGPLRSVQWAAGTTAFLAFATGATALGGEWVRGDYFVPLVQARAAGVAQLESEGRCRLCYSSRRGEVGRGDLLGDTRVEFGLQADRHEVVAGTAVTLVLAAHAGERPALASAAVDFGDGTSARASVFGQTTIRHTYDEAGVRTAEAWFSGSAAGRARRSLVITVVPRDVQLQGVVDVPAALRDAPVRDAVERISVVRGELSVRRADGARAGSVWMMVWHDGEWHVRPSDSIASVPHGAWTAVLACDSDCATRTAPAFIRWPDPAVLSDGVTVYSAAAARAEP